jgi:hypothetical protein
VAFYPEKKRLTVNASIVLYSYSEGRDEIEGNSIKVAENNI